MILLCIVTTDGGYSDNLPVLDCHTITVSPFSGTADICPPPSATGPSPQHGLAVSFSNTAVEVTEAERDRA